MPVRSTIDQLPAEAREWLEKELLDRGFSGYVELTDDFIAKCHDLGIELSLSVSTVHRWGQSFEDRVDALKRTTLMAQTIARELGDDEGAMTDAVIRLVQDKMFSTVLEQNLSPKALNSIAHAAADLARASVTQKKHMAAVRTKVGEKLAKLEADAQNHKSRLDPETVRHVREAVFGLFD